MICDHCGADTAKMEGTVKRCWCGLWIETQPEVDDIEALKEFCQLLPAREIRKYKPHTKIKITSDEHKARNREKQRAWYRDHREHEKQRKRNEYQAKKLKRAA